MLLAAGAAELLLAAPISAEVQETKIRAMITSTPISNQKPRPCFFFWGGGGGAKVVAPGCWGYDGWPGPWYAGCGPGCMFGPGGMCGCCHCGCGFGGVGVLIKFSPGVGSAREE